jgi:glycosyltransferase involved in cell wall biosynthesis
MPGSRTVGAKSGRVRNHIEGVSEVIELSIILPCLNEERTVGNCVAAGVAFLKRHRIRGEVIVADNGSNDRSPQVAAARGARVVVAQRKGYGNALRAGFQVARGKYIVMADADESYDLSNLMPFIGKLRAGFDLVMGNRFQGGISRGAMPWHHRWIGNPVLSFIGRLFFQTPSHDFHCGMRGFTRQAVRRMALQSGGMELASEIVIKASLLKMKVCEVPTRLRPDRRGRPPHLRSFHDGWRHLRFLLLFSPRWLFAYPGLLLALFGGLLSAVLLTGPIRAGGRLLDFHSLFLTGAMIVLGSSMLAFSVIARVFAYNAGLLPSRPAFFRLSRFLNLERGLLAGFLAALVGAGLIAYASVLSTSPGFSTIGFDRSIRLVYAGSMALIIGGQTVLTSFLLSVLGMKLEAWEPAPSSA